MSRVLVAGSYPPVPGPAAQVTLAEVRRILAEGDEVEVVSPRTSAAHHVGTLWGLRAPTTLARLRRRGRFDRLVFCLEPTVPFDVGVSRRRLGLEVRALGASLGRFAAVELLVPPSLVDHEGVARLARARNVTVRHWPLAEDPVPGVTAHGPPRWVRGERLEAAMAHLELRASRVARAVLGRHRSAVGRPLRWLLGPLRHRTQTRPPPT